MKHKWDIEYDDWEYRSSLTVRSETLKVNFKENTLEADGVVIELNSCQFLKLLRDGHTIWNWPELSQNERACLAAEMLFS